MARRNRPKYRLPPSRPPRRSGKGWILLLLVAVAAGWGLWKFWPRTPDEVADAKTRRTGRPAVKPEAPGVQVATNLSRPPSAEIPQPAASPPLRGRPPIDPLEGQIAMARRGISAGSLDGAMGTQTRAALRAFQIQAGLEQTGALDTTTRAALTVESEPFSIFLVTQADLDGLAPVPASWLGKSLASRLGFETLLELVAEHSHAHPALIRRLNPGVNWAAVPAGTSLRVPAVEFPPPRTPAALVRISLTEKWLRAFDAGGGLLAHFPCSIAARVDKRPVGDLHVEVVIKDPNYTFNPEVFPESPEGRELGRKLVLPPGPNNPVGVAWIGLDRPGYGIHGTPKPEDVGRTESHGCFRLANWNAELLRQTVRVGTRVSVEW